MEISTPNQIKNELFNNIEAAEYLGVKPRTLEAWRCTKRHKIPFIKVGRLVKYRKSTLDAFLESRTMTTKKQKRRKKSE